MKFKKALLAMLVCGSIYSPGALANGELDRQFAMESIGHLKSWDNVDGLFSDYVAQAYQDYFSHQTRFVVQDLSKAESLMATSKLPYNKLIDDPEVLGQLARSMRVESLIRTKVFKEGPAYRFVVEWLHSPRMEVLSTESFNMQEPVGGTSFGMTTIKASLNEALDRMFKKVPFTGQVTGRDNGEVTLNLGKGGGLQKGDTIVIGTIEEVKRHPLLKNIVDWRIVETGRVEIESVDEKITFAKVLEEEQGHQISRYQKIVQIIPKPVTASPEVMTERQEEQRAMDRPPTLGWIVGDIMLGSVSRQITDSLGNGQTGSGVFFGAQGEGQLWMTREWFFGMDLGGGTVGYSQNNLSTGAISVNSGSSSVFFGRLETGYTFFTNSQLFGPKGWVKLGYQWTSYTFPTMGAFLLVPSSFNGLFLGVGGDLPIRDTYGAMMALDFGFMNSASAEGLPYGDVNSSHHLAFSIGGYYRSTPRLSFRLNFNIVADSADFTEGATLSNKILTFGPSVQYFF